MTNYFKPDTNTRAGALIQVNASAPVYPYDVCNRALLAALPQSAGTNSILEFGHAGGIEWMECPDSLWATVSPHLQGIEVTSATTVAPAGYLRRYWRSTMGRFTDRRNLVVITDSIGWQGGDTLINGVDSYPTIAFEKWSKASSMAAFGSILLDREFIAPKTAMLHYGISGSYFGATGGTDIQSDHLMMAPTKYETLGLTANDVIYVALGTNDMFQSPVQSAAAVWARAQNFIGLLKTAMPNTPIVLSTVIRLGAGVSDNSTIDTYNGLLRAGAAALGITVFDMEQAHADFSATTGDTTSGSLYKDGVHLTDGGNTVAGAALATLLKSL